MIGYVNSRGIGIRRKLISGMRAHNGTQPDLLATDHGFTVRLWGGGRLWDLARPLMQRVAGIRRRSQAKP